jgi:hypothetical protein
MYGIALIDKLVEKHGLHSEQVDNPFQSVHVCVGGAVPQTKGLSLPFCINRFLYQAPLYSRWILHQLWLPKSNKPLACFLINQRGKVVERVYYQNGRKYYEACDKLLQHIERLHSEERTAA